jgi:zinc protease
MVLYGLDDSYFDSYRTNIQSVTASDVLEAAQRHLDPARLRLIVVGDAPTIRNELESLSIGPVVVHDTDGAPLA